MRGGWKKVRAGFAPADGRRLAAWLTPYPVPGANLSPQEALARRGPPREGPGGAASSRQRGRRPLLGRRGARGGDPWSPRLRAGRPRRGGSSDNGPQRVGMCQPGQRLPSRIREGRGAPGGARGSAGTRGRAPGRGAPRGAPAACPQRLPRLRLRHPRAGWSLIGQNRTKPRVCQVLVLFCFLSGEKHPSLFFKFYAGLFQVKLCKRKVPFHYLVKD